MKTAAQASIVCLYVAEARIDLPFGEKEQADACTIAVERQGYLLQPTPQPSAYCIPDFITAGSCQPQGEKLSNNQ